MLRRSAKNHSFTLFSFNNNLLYLTQYIKNSIISKCDQHEQIKETSSSTWCAVYPHSTPCLPPAAFQGCGLHACSGCTALERLLALPLARLGAPAWVSDATCSEVLPIVGMSAAGQCEGSVWQEGLGSGWSTPTPGIAPPSPSQSPDSSGTSLGVRRGQVPFIPSSLGCSWPPSFLMDSRYFAVLITCQATIDLFKNRKALLTLKCILSRESLGTWGAPEAVDIFWFWS